MAKTHNQAQAVWSVSDIQKLFKPANKLKHKTTLFKSEDKGLIPASERVKRGSSHVRKWRTEDLPEIGARFGFLKKPKSQKVICVYTAKGGVLKTTVAYSLSRALALNGIRTCIVGLDIQCSITDILVSPPDAESLDEYEARPLGLYQLLYEKARLDEVLLATDLPTLDIIPESPELNLLEKRLRNEARREYVLKDKLLKKLSDYDVVIFDNGPSWSQLIENALTASQHIISPAGCDIGTYQALKTNLDTLFEFREAMKLDWGNFMLVPTLLEKTKLSQQIYGAYLNEYPDNILATPIRRGIKGQEATVLGMSAIEHDPGATLAQDYYEFLQAVWSKIL